MEVNFYDEIEDKLLKFAVIVARYEDKWIYCKHKDRDTFEIPGGHREGGETILDAAKRELQEETGAKEFELEEVGVYGVKRDESETYGKLYFAQVKTLEELPQMEIERIILMKNMPQKLTYPLIQPKLQQKVEAYLACKMEIRVEQLEYEKKLILNHLMELYNYDFSEFLDEDVNEFGLYGYKFIDQYWTEEGRYPYIIRVNQKIAGFVLVRGWKNDGVQKYSIAEFFVLKKYRRQHVGKRVAHQIFDKHCGNWEISQIENNLPAQSFWINVINEYTNGNYKEIRNKDWDGPIQVFDSNKVYS